MTEPFDSMLSPDEPVKGPTTGFRDKRRGARRSRWVLGAVVLLALMVTGGLLIASRESSDSATNSQTTAQANFDIEQIKKICAPGGWPKLYDGQPTSLDVASTGFFVWRTADGWTVRSRGPNDVQQFTIVLTTTSNIDPASIQVDSPDGGQLTISGNTATFTVSSEFSLNGIDFTACPYPEFRLDLLADGNLVPESSVYVGPDGRALENPIRAKRS